MKYSKYYENAIKIINTNDAMVSISDDNKKLLKTIFDSLTALEFYYKDKAYSLNPAMAHFLEHYLIEHSIHGNLFHWFYDKNYEFNELEYTLFVKTFSSLIKLEGENNLFSFTSSSIKKIAKEFIDEVYKEDEKIELSTREFELLKYLMENAGIVLSKEQIFESVWGSNYGDIGTVAVNIKSLRDKLKDKNKYIITIWGYGYKFVRNVENEK